MEDAFAYFKQKEREDGDFYIISLDEEDRVKNMY